MTDRVGTVINRLMPSVRVVLLDTYLDTGGRTVEYFSGSYGVGYAQVELTFYGNSFFQQRRYRWDGKEFDAEGRRVYRRVYWVY